MLNKQQKSLRLTKVLLYILPLVYSLCCKAASIGTMEDGILAFTKGNYSTAQTIFSNILSSSEDERETIYAKVYLLAINDTPTKVPALILRFIQEEASKGDHIFKVLEGRLHLLGLYPESNKASGLKLIKEATMDNVGYAFYTLGLYHMGIFGGMRNIKEADSYYRLALGHNFQAAAGKIAGIRLELDRLLSTEGAAWDAGTTTSFGILDFSSESTVKDEGSMLTEMLIMKSSNRGVNVSGGAGAAVYPTPFREGFASHGSLYSDEYTSSKEILKDAHKVPTLKERVEGFDWGPPLIPLRAINLPPRPENFLEHTFMEKGESYLGFLWKNLFQLEPGFITGREGAKKYTITGMGGIGKTILALEYAYQAYFNNAYDVIYWVHCENKDSLIEDYKKLLERLEISNLALDAEKTISIIREKLPELSKKWLLVYDNVPSADFLRGLIPEKNGHVLITTRDQRNWHWKNLLKMDVFMPQDSIKYLFDVTGIRPTEEEKIKALNVAEELGHLPLALAHAAKYMGMKRLGFNDYYKFFREKKEDVLLYHPEETIRIKGTALIKAKTSDEKEKALRELQSCANINNYPYIIAATSAITKSSLSVLSYKYLKIFSYLEPDNIFLAWFTPHETKDTVDTVLNDLESFSMIKYNDREKSISIHKLVQYVTRIEHETSSKETIKDLFEYIHTHFVDYLSHLLKGKEITDIESGQLPSIHSSLVHLLGNVDLLTTHEKRIEEDILNRKKIFETGGFEALSEYINKLQDKIVEKLLTYTSSLEDASSTVDFSSLVQSHLHITPLQYDEIIRKAASSMDEKLSLYEKFQILRAFLKEKKPDAAMLKTTSEVKRIISTVVPTPEPKAKTVDEISSMGTAFYTLGMKGEDRAHIINAVKNIEPAKWDKIKKYALELITTSMTGVERASIIDALKVLEPHYLDNAKTFTLSLVTPKMSGHERASIIFAVKDIKPEAWPNIKKNIKSVASKRENSNISKLIDVIKHIPEFQWEDNNIGERALSLITPTMPCAERAYIIDAIKDISPHLWEGILGQVHSFLIPEMNGEARAILITSFAKVVPHRYEEVRMHIQYTFSLVPATIDGKMLTHMLKVAKDINHTQWNDISHFLLPGLRKWHDVYDRLYIMSNIRDLSNGNWTDLKSCINDIVTDEMEATGKLIIIRTALELNLYKFLEIKPIVLELITERMNGFERADIILTLNEVHPAFWKKIIQPYKGGKYENGHVIANNIFRDSIRKGLQLINKHGSPIITTHEPLMSSRTTMPQITPASSLPAPSITEPIRVNVYGTSTALTTEYTSLVDEEKSKKCCAIQ